MTTPQTFSLEQVELAAAFYLLSAQQSARALGTQAMTGIEDDDTLIELADDLLRCHPASSSAARISINLFAYRLVRDTSDLGCLDTSQHRLQLIAAALAAPA